MELCSPASGGYSSSSVRLMGSKEAKFGVTVA
jgi:hypothetical protein